MPRGKKPESSSSSSKKTKKVDVSDNELEAEDQTQVVKKKSLKKDKVIKKSKKTDSDNEANEADQLDELSDLDLDDEDGDGNDAPAIESGDNDTIVASGNRREKPQRKIIDPTTPIGDLSIQDGLSYYIQLGEELCNPQLRYGALDLLNRLTGKPRRRRNFGSKTNYGSKSSRNNGPNNNENNGRVGNNQRNFDVRNQNHNGHQNPHQPVSRNTRGPVDRKNRGRKPNTENMYGDD